MARQWRLIGAALLVAFLLYSIAVVIEVSSSVEKTKLSTVAIHHDLQDSLEEQRKQVAEARAEEAAHLSHTLRALDSKLMELDRRRESGQERVTYLLQNVRTELVAGQQRLVQLARPLQRSSAEERVEVLAAAAAAGSQRLQMLSTQLEKSLEQDRQQAEELYSAQKTLEELRIQLLFGSALGGSADDGPELVGSSAHAFGRDVTPTPTAAPWEEDPCVAPPVHGEPAAVSLMDLLGFLPAEPLLTAMPSGFASSLDELMVKNSPTLLVRLGFPSTSSTLTRNTLEKIAELTAEERLPNCHTPRVVGCGYMRDSAVEFVQHFGGNLTTLPDIGQHAVLSSKLRGARNQIAEQEGFDEEPLVVTMLREPAQYAHRVFHDRQSTGKSFEDEIKSLGVSTVSHEILHFDFVFEDVTKCSLLRATEEQWIDLAHWRWNYFTRGLAEDYQHSLWMTSKQYWSRTRDEEWSQNLEGSESKMLHRAIETLNSFHYFGIFDRLQESMELMAFSFCVDFEALDFQVEESRRSSLASSEEHLVRGADAIGQVAFDILRERNLLDYLLFEYAEALFDRRLAAMRKAKQLGYRCLKPDTSCGLAC